MGCTDVRTDALVVGGGPVGLVCAGLIAKAGARTLLVDRKRSVSYYPKARSVSVRSMEILRQLGVDKAVQRAMPPERARHYAVGGSLTSPELRLEPFGLGNTEPTPLSPCTGSVCTQDRLEPILYEHLRHQALATTLFGAELVSFEEHRTHVRALVRDGEETFGVEAKVLIGADGAQGVTAALSGIGSAETLKREARATVLFRAGLSRLIEPHDCIYLLLGEPGTPFHVTLSGASLARDPEEWSLFVACDPARGENLDRYPEHYWVELVRRVTGLPELDVRISGVALWWRGARIADAMARGRVALAGDAAHLMPPAGGLGMNTGLMDAQNLGWRVAAIAGGAPVALLDDYDRERLPEVRRTVEAAVRNDEFGVRVASLWDRPQLGLSLGAECEEGSFVADGTAPATREYPYHDYAPNGRPGARAPHLWLDAGRSVSVLDLFGSRFVLLTQSARSPFLASVHRLKREDEPVEGYALDERLAPEDLAAWRQLYGVEPPGAVLVRPDGVIAWRSRDGLGDVGLALRAIVSPGSTAPASAGPGAVRVDPLVAGSAGPAGQGACQR